MKPSCFCCEGLDCGTVHFIVQRRFATVQKCGHAPLTGGGTKRYKKATRTQTASGSFTRNLSGDDCGVNNNISWSSSESRTYSGNLETSGEIVIGPDGHVQKTVRTASGSASETRSFTCSPQNVPGCCTEGGDSENEYGSTFSIDEDAAEVSGCQTLLPGSGSIESEDTGEDGGASMDLGASAGPPTVTPTRSEETFDANAGYDEWSGSDVTELEDEYTDAEALTNLQTALGEWEDSNASPGASLFTTSETDFLTASGDTRRFKLKIKIPNTCVAKYRWKTRFTPQWGGDVVEQEFEADFSIGGTREHPCHIPREGYDPEDDETWPVIDGPDGGWWEMALPDEPGELEIIPYETPAPPDVVTAGGIQITCFLED